MTSAKLNQADKAKAELDLLQQKASACADACPKAAELKAAGIKYPRGICAASVVSI